MKGKKYVDLYVAIAILFIGFLSLDLYFIRTGLYRDDWIVLLRLSNADGLYDSIPKCSSRPFLYPVYSMLNRIFGLNLWAYSLNLLFWHCMNAFLLYLILKRYFHCLISFAISLLWMLYPANSSIHWKLYISIEIAMTLCLVSFYFYTKSITEQNKRWFNYISALLFLMGILIYEAFFAFIIVFPFLCILMKREKSPGLLSFKYSANFRGPLKIMKTFALQLFFILLYILYRFVALKSGWLGFGDRFQDYLNLSLKNILINTIAVIPSNLVFSWNAAFYKIITADNLKEYIIFFIIIYAIICACLHLIYYSTRDKIINSSSLKLSVSLSVTGLLLILIAAVPYMCSGFGASLVDFWSTTSRIHFALDIGGAMTVLGILLFFSSIGQKNKLYLFILFTLISLLLSPISSYLLGEVINLSGLKKSGEFLRVLLWIPCKANISNSLLKFLAILAFLLVFTIIFILIPGSINRKVSESHLFFVSFTALIVSFSATYQYSVHKDYVRAWDIQKNFWRGLMKTCPGLKTHSVILIYGLPENQSIGVLNQGWEIRSALSLLYNTDLSGSMATCSHTGEIIKKDWWRHYRFMKEGFYLDPYNTDRPLDYNRLVLVKYNQEEKNVKVVPEMNINKFYPDSELKTIYTNMDNISQIPPIENKYRKMILKE